MEEIRFLPLVKAYPALSKTYGEVSCVAGLQIQGSDRPEWIRLYPVPYRALDDEQRFRKYQLLRLRVESHGGDRRPETRRPDRDSIQLEGPFLSSDQGWRARRPYVEPMIAESMCALQRQQREDGTSLGLFRPREVSDLLIEETDVDAEKRRIAEASVAQGSLLDGEERAHALKAIEQIPYSFKYRYHCSDPDCNGHTQTIIDWEIVQFYRRVRSAADWQDRLRKKWLGQVCGKDRDAALMVGNQHQHLNAFMVLGVWWPPLQAEQLLLG
jgi:hypothetical protein